MKSKDLDDCEEKEESPISFKPRCYFVRSTPLNDLKCLLNKIVKTKFFLIISKFEFKKIYKENTDEIAKLLANFSGRNPYFNEMYSQVCFYLFNRCDDQEFKDNLSNCLFSLCKNKLIEQNSEMRKEEQINETYKTSLSIFKFMCELKLVNVFTQDQITSLLKFEDLGSKIEYLLLAYARIGEVFSQNEDLVEILNELEEKLAHLSEYHFFDQRTCVLFTTMFEFIKKNSFGITEEFKTKLLDFYAGLFREEKFKIPVECMWFDEDDDS